MSHCSCFVVGNGVIPLSCLEILIQQGWQIQGIHSTDGSLQGWAQQQGIPHTDLRSVFQQQLLNNEYDYLFSINNIQWIIPAEILARARKATLNYHDSLLPRYAGLHATSWALLKGEREHGITWHEVTPEIDAGRIFCQKTVPILPEDTALTLNTRCSAAAVSAFEEMIRHLTIGDLKPQAQDLSQRSYFSPSDRPAAAAMLLFDTSSQEIYNLVRALAFGPTHNPLGVAKLWLPGGVVAVESTRILVLSEVIAQAPSAADQPAIPGQVLKISTDGLVVTTADGAIQLQGFTTLEGVDLSEKQLVTDYGVAVGTVLPRLDLATLSTLSDRNLAVSRHENRWVKHLRALAPFHHPYLPISVTHPIPSTAIERHAITCPLTSAQSLLAIFAAYCTRLTPEPEFDLGLQTDAQRSIAPEIFAQRVPLRVQTQPEESFQQFQARFTTVIDQIGHWGTYRHSVLRRDLQLRSGAETLLLPVTIVAAPSPEHLKWPDLKAALVFVAYEDGSVPEVVHSDAIAVLDGRAIAGQLETFISACLDQPEQPLYQLPLLSRAEQQQVLVDWNQTHQSFASHLCIHQLFEQQVAATPDAIALTVAGRSLTYQELNARANQLAHHLKQQGVEPDDLVGVHVARSVEMMVALLGIHKAGAAYLPLDPEFPQERIAFMVQDSQTAVILTQEKYRSHLQVETDVQIIALDRQWAEIVQQPETNPDSGATPENLSYVIYTSGSTGRPKGVMVEHRNVVNFFTGMDAVIHQADRPDAAKVWLAVTSLSFDISVWELLWTLTRGFQVVLQTSQKQQTTPTAPIGLKHGQQTIDFSLFYFSSHEEDSSADQPARSKYHLLCEGAKFADAHGFKAIWTPERHFHAFGGLFPNPAVTSAAIAAMTEHIQIRAGSCVSPLHSSIRIAEDWSLVDNLSQGRVGVSFAAGWQPNDFVLRPETFQDRKEILFQQIEEVKALWRGEAVTYPNGKGDPVAVKTLPRPIQPDLPIWVTAAGNPETFRVAGEKGCHLLTHLLGQSLEELATKIAVYRQAWLDHGHPGQGTVTLMIHTFVGEDDRAVREIVRQPMRQYLGSSLDLIKQAAWSFPTFKQKTINEQGQFSMAHLDDRDREAVLDFSFERYFETSGLFGTVETCLQMVDRIKGIGVDEIAALIDYGVSTEQVLAQLPLLEQVKTRSQPQAESDPEPVSIADLIRQHQVTHLQCTPSMANLLLTDSDTRAALGQLQALMVGGEALTEALATQLKAIVPGQIHNMYGPTETTIWSATHTLDQIDGVVPIGRPIANTELYVLSPEQQPVPIGVAGELWIGGYGVTRGYLHRSQLTQERFIPNPFRRDDPTGRLYRTGDRVRYRPDGTLEFLGRMDFQVKVRGYRIELGEIETVLSRHPAIREAVIVAREDQPGDKRLVAYLLPNVEQPPTANVLRDYLLGHFPEYMVPSNFVWLEQFPLTPNRKVDRKALPAPILSSVEIAQPQSSTQTPLEQELLTLWQQILQVAPIGLQDNFFDLGGNSLIAVSLIEAMRSAFQVNLPLLSLFRAPTVASMAEQIREAQAQQATASTPIVASQTNTPDPIVALPILNPDPSQRYEPFPLTGLQQAYWVGRSGEVEMGQVASHGYVELEGDFDLARLNQAWQQMIDRHDMLRAIVHADGTQQVLENLPPYVFRMLDLRNRDAETVATELLAVRDRMSHQILPSDRYPLFDIQATQLTDRRSRIHVSLDALIVDGWSIAIVYREWAAFYNQLQHNQPFNPDPLEITFRDYVVAERSLNATKDYERSRDYWRQRLNSLPLGPELPLAKQPSALTSGKFVRREAIVKADTWQRLKTQASQRGITVPGILAAAYAEVLALWSPERHFCINVPSFNRFPLHPQVNQLIGESASFTVLEVDNRSDDSFAERLQRLQAQLWSDLDHRFFSGIEVLRELALSRNQLSGSLMPIVFTAIPADDTGESTYATVRAEALGEVVYAINQTSQVYLDNHVFEHQGALHCHWDTVEELFPAGLSQTLLDAFTQLLELLATDESLWQQSWSTIVQRVMAALDLPIVVAGDEQPVPEILLQDLITQQVSQRPDQPAVITTQRTLTYQELSGLAHRWGRHLQTLGARANHPIAIVMEKGWEQVVAALGVLHSGAAYLPIDATVGKERLHYLLDNGQVEVVLTQSWLDQRLEWPESVQRIAVDHTSLDHIDDRPIAPIQTPDDLAFVLYTSGSTGLPKGVMIAHRGLVNAVVSTQAKFGITATDRILGLTALHHDMSIFDIFGVLGAGGQLVLPDPNGRRDPAHWSELIVKHQITLWNSVPAMMDMLLAYVGDRADLMPPTLRLAFLGGDWIPLTLPDRLASLVPAAKVVSVGGPTETTLWNIWHPVEAMDPTWKSIPYGRPIPNTRYYLLNDALVECPTWVTGEMCVAGVGVAKGYWQDPEKTAAKFIQHPTTGERLYRTGDLGRRCPDGTIEFMGRADFQVKINGQRIELGEIEATLQQSPEVQSAIVVAPTDRKGKRLLAAYVTPVTGQTPSTDGLRSFLQAQLPEHMVPAAIVILEQFPLTANGKLDRQALPDPFAVTPTTTATSATSTQSSALVTQISQIVAEVLQLETVDLHGNLLSLGANSLDMVRMGNQLEKVFKSRPRIDELFRLQSIQALVDYYEQRLGKASTAQASPDAATLGNANLLSGYTVILDPIAREKFKKSRPGVRRDFTTEPVIELASPIEAADLTQKYRDRSSYRKFLLQAIPFDNFSRLLSNLSQIILDGQSKFLYASPGGLNATQVYLHVKPGRVQGVPAGVYYYHPETHQLVTLTANVDLDRSLHIPFINTPMFDECAFSIFFVADLDAIGPGYGERGIHFVTLESGIMAHQLEIAGPQDNIGLCQVGSIDFDQIRPWFKLKDTHILIHSTLGGYIDRSRSSRADVSNTSGQTAEKATIELLGRIQGLSDEEVKQLLTDTQASL